MAGLSRAGRAGVEVCVCNAAHMQNVPGRKTDLADCQQIAELHEHVLLRPSFIPTGDGGGVDHHLSGIHGRRR